MQVNKILLLRIYPEIFNEILSPFCIDPPFTLKYIQSLIKKEFNIKPVLKDCFTTNEKIKTIINHVKEEKYDIIIIYSTLINSNECNKAANILKDINVPFIIGIGSGLNKQYENNSVGLHYDIVILGEPEFELINIIKKINENYDYNEIIKKYLKDYKDNIYYLIENLDDLPFPEYSLKEMNLYKLPYPVTLSFKLRWGIIIASRGCNSSCIFCSEIVRTSFSRKLRYRSPKNIVDEMLFLIKSGANVISFEDDNITANKFFAIELSNEIINRKIKINWIARARADEIDDEIIKYFSKAGCIHLGIGVESANERIITLLQKQKTYKKLWTSYVENAVKLCRDNNISTAAFYIIGNPTEKLNEVEETINFALKLDTDIIQIHFFTLYIDTNAYKLLKKNHIHNFLQQHHYVLPNINISDISNDELNKIRNRFYFKYIFRVKFIIKHLKKYFLFYMFNPIHFFQNLKIIKSILNI